MPAKSVNEQDRWLSINLFGQGRQAALDIKYDLVDVHVSLCIVLIGLP